MEITTDTDKRLCVLAITSQYGFDTVWEKDVFTSSWISSYNHTVAGNIMYPKNGKVRIEAKMLLPRGTELGNRPAFLLDPTSYVRSKAVHQCFLADISVSSPRKLFIFIL